MITVSITYPRKKGANFDFDYFTANHLPLIGRAWGPNLRMASVLRGVEDSAGGEPPYVAMLWLTFADIETARQTLASDAGREVLDDSTNFTSIRPQVQLNSPFE